MRILSLIQPLVYLVYSTIFLTIGVIIAASPEEAISIIVFQLIIAVSFFIPIGSSQKKLSNALSNNSTFSKYDYWLIGLLILLGPGFLIFCFLWFFVPIFEINVESQRVVFEQNVGFMYRISVLTFYVLAPALIICLNRSKVFLVKILYLVIWLACVITIIATGYRSRIIDFFLLSLLTHVLILIWKGNSLKKFIVKNFIWLVLVAIIPILLIFVITALRTNDADSETVLALVIERIFVLNYEVNINRIYLYTDDLGYMWGMGYINDLVSMVSGTKSMQEVVSVYFNRRNSDLFVMTPTMYGETYLNFGQLSLLLGPVIILIYRLITESLLEVCTFLMRNSMFTIIFTINVLYALPRVTATGGVSNAFLTRIIPFLIALVMVRVILLVLKQFSVRQGIKVPTDNTSEI